MRLIKQLAVVVLLLSTDRSFAGAQQPSVPAAAPIEAFNRALADATRRMDNSASLALWDDDGVSLMPTTPAKVGKKAIADFLTSVMAQIAGSRMEKFDMKCFDIQVVAGWASEWCVEHQVVHLADDTTFDGWGKMAFVLRRGADGAWRLKQETWIPALPADSILLR